MRREAGKVKQSPYSAGSVRRRGAATVELAIVIPLILFLLFSIVEMGLLVKDRAELGQAAREAVRMAAVGATPSRMTDAVNASLATLPQAEVTREYDYRSWDEDAAAWGAWTTLGTDGTENNAGQGDQIRVRLNYGHRILVPGIMGPVLNADENGKVALSAASVMMRE